MRTVEFLCAVASACIVAWASGYATHRHFAEQKTAAYCAEATALSEQMQLEIPAIVADCKKV